MLYMELCVFVDDDDDDDDDVWLEPCNTTCDNVSYLRGGLYYTVKVSESYEGDTRSTRHAILLPDVSVSFICLQ